jgi:hypothetical protein
VRLLAWREVTPVTRRPLRRLWHKAAAWSSCCTQSQLEATDAKRALISWLEAESLRHCTAKYCTLEPAPRSTIAAAFSPDGNTLASTQYVLLFCSKLFVELASPLSRCVCCSLWCSSAISWPGCSYSSAAHMCLELEAFCVYYTPSIIFW